MYTIVERRNTNVSQMGQTVERAHAEFFPKLKAADGFVGFYLVADESSGVNTAVIVWESKEAADAFDPASQVWQRSLEDMGHALQSENRGETMIQIEASH